MPLLSDDARGTVPPALSVPELLAPAGGPAEFNAALAAGADAIYCGFGTTFNARRGAQSFDSSSFEEACRRAHLVGAHVYVTVNVVIRDDELPSVLALIRRAWLLGADAFIIQDWGLLQEVRTRWPQIPCHVSTQANVHDARGVAWCRELGADRVTVSRELSIAELGRLAQEGVPIECFCHGAICICYSGVCQMSSSVGDRSANRGACAQPCRLPYELIDGQGRVLSSPDRGRPLCPKDYYSFDALPELIDAGVASLKVEGRLKGPDYVHAVISSYRAQLDDLAQGHESGPQELSARRTRLKRAFNRDFTDAYLRGASNDELMSYERSNNRGELVGEVIRSQHMGTVKVRRGGGGGGRARLRTSSVVEVDVRLDKPVEKGDLLELRPVTDPTQFVTAHAQENADAGAVTTCRTTRMLEAGSLVRVIRSQRAMDEGERAANSEIPRRRPVHVRVRARLGEPFLVELSTIDGSVRAHATGFVVEKARTRAVSESDLISHVGRMGATWFEPVGFLVELDDGCGMGFSAVHEVRAAACDALEQALLAPYQERSLEGAPSREAIRLGLRVPSADAEHRFDGVEIAALVTDPQAARAACEAGATRLYAIPHALEHGAWPRGVIPVLDEVCREQDHGRLDHWVRRDEPVAVGNVSELALAHARGARAEVRGSVPVHNLSCLRAMEEAGAAGVWLSSELSLDEIAILAHGARVPVGLLAYSFARAMTTEHCVLQVANRCVHDCARCALRKQATYLRGDANERFRVQTDAQGRSRVYAPRVLDLVPSVPRLFEAGVTRLLVDGTFMDPAEVASAVSRLRNAIEAHAQGKPLPRSVKGSTTGHLFSPIG